VWSIAIRLLVPLNSLRPPLSDARIILTRPAVGDEVTRGCRLGARGQSSSAFLYLNRLHGRPRGKPLLLSHSLYYLASPYAHRNGRAAMAGAPPTWTA
jgi:hypothetical protein